MLNVGMLANEAVCGIRSGVDIVDPQELVQECLEAFEDVFRMTTYMVEHGREGTAGGFVFNYEQAIFESIERYQFDCACQGIVRDKWLEAQLLEKKNAAYDYINHPDQRPVLVFRNLELCQGELTRRDDMVAFINAVASAAANGFSLSDTASQLKDEFGVDLLSLLRIAQDQFPHVIQRVDEEYFSGKYPVEGSLDDLINKWQDPLHGRSMRFAGCNIPLKLRPLLDCIEFDGHASPVISPN